MAAHPYITAALPSVVPRHPDPSCMQQWPWTFNDHCRWSPCVNNDFVFAIPRAMQLRTLRSKGLVSFA